VARFARVVGCSWRADETYILIGRWYYLHRAVDKQGRTVDFVLREDRGIEVAQAFFRGPLTSQPDRPPRKVTLDGHVPSHRAIKRRCAPMKGIKSFADAAITIAGIEPAHRIHKKQFSLGQGRPHSGRSLRTDWQRALA